MEKKMQTQKKTSPVRPADHYLVGIGASAGGLEAIHTLFDHFPNNSSFSFVIIQHLSPDHKSLMAELLTKHTRMQVREAEDKMHTRPNCVYVLPSGKQLTLEHGRLRLAHKERNREPNFAIDLFFASLAKDRGQCAIGVVLSGTGTDGTKGIKAIKEAGGMVVVQDPGTAKFDGMPRSAIEAGHADYVLSPEKMPEEIINYTKKVPLVQAVHEPGSEEYEDETLKEILDLVCIHTKTDFSDYKKATLNRRIQKRMGQLRINDLPKYYEYLQQHPAEVKQLCQEFFINVTKFFRDKEAFDLFEREVIPKIIADKAPDEPVKVWVTACSTGEEVYSLAMLFWEAYKRMGREPLVKLFATDIDQRAITKASKAVFPATIAADMTKERFERFFRPQGTSYALTEEIRKMVIFAQHDLQKDPPFSKMDLITCRNMLIYLNSNLQNKVLGLFPYALNMKGYLMLGPSEHIGELKVYFTEEDRKWKLYRKDKASYGVKQQYGITDYSPPIEPILKTGGFKAPQMTQYNEVFMDTVTEDFKVTGLYVDETFQLLHGIGEINRYLKFPDNRLHFNLLKMVSEDLAVTLSVGIRKALKQNKKVVVHKSQIRVGTKVKAVQVTFKPISEDVTHPRIVLVLLQELAPVNIPPKPVDLDTVSDADYYQQLTTIESELKDARESLQLTVQDLSTANEELQSSNEELMSSNEELQSSNEEMQSLNEELHTVNSEHQLKIRELQELNEDLDNYMRSSNVGQLFVDHELIIRKFTPTVKSIINIIDGDLGRPIHHLSHNLRYAHLQDTIQKVNNTSEEVEQEVETMEGQYFLMRIIPYLKHDGNKDGVVVSFVNITTLKSLSNVVEGVVNSSLNSIMALMAVRNEEHEVTDFRWMLLNQQAEELIGKTQEQLVETLVQQETGFLRRSGLFKKLVQVVETGQPMHKEQHMNINGESAWYEISAVKMGDGVAVTMANINEKKDNEEKTLLAYEELKKAEENLIRLNNELERRVAERTQALTSSEERFRLVSMATNDVVWDWNLADNSVWWSDSLTTILGYEINDMGGGVEGWFALIHPDDRETIVKGINQAINYGKDQWSGEYRIARRDGSYAFVANRAYIMHNEYKIPYRMLGSFIDLSDLREAQEKLQNTNEHLIRVNSDLDTFVYTASHDLKAPVANIEGLVLLLEDQLKTAGPLPGMPTEPVFGMVKNAITRFKNVIKDLTDIAKVQRDVDGDAKSLDLEEVLEDVKQNIQENITLSKAQLHVDLDEVRSIRFSRKNLYSILFNLISNAINYRSPDRQPQIYIKTAQEGDYTVLSVQDNGLGMSEDNLTKIFTLFKRFHTHVDGTGMGLYIVKRMMDNAGGRIEVESEQDQGTTFRLYFSTEKHSSKKAVAAKATD
ncbi:PAS domain-containing protein [Pontibacter sp. E15-1]|uniref:chemotaxis protein CheB n=1 Tax=Pontibacter sp. E15-1 TaxID=2919918 RepID=UPI001F4F5486|nr:chemotaxis protein CheB [Pontibacter sp. E15-1]MCJ8165038.1 PAS domain-containing protein [Pontibacter sp. E15-1]